MSIKNDLNVAFIFEDFEQSGIGVLLLDTVKNARKYGLNIKLISLGTGVLEDEFSLLDCERLKLIRKWPIDIKVIYRIRKFIKEKKINVLHANQPVEGIHAYLASLGINTKTVLSFHGYIPSFKDDLVARFLIPRVSANIAVSYGFLERIKREAKFGKLKNFHVVYNGVNYQKIQDGENKNILSKLAPGDTLKLGMVGNFNSSGRDQMTVCKALVILFKKYDNIHFFFIGARSENAPQYYDDCVNYCKKNNIIHRVHFLGERNDVYDLLKELDIFVYSSNHDSFGIAVVEAMLSELPIIINNLPPLLEVTNNGESAMVFQTGSPTDLASKIALLVENKELRYELAKKAKTQAFNNFTIKSHISQLHKLYNSLF